LSYTRDSLQYEQQLIFASGILLREAVSAAFFVGQAKNWHLRCFAAFLKRMICSPMMRAAFLAVLLCQVLPLFANAEDRRPNILMIAVDDLRPQLGCYGVERVHSPNIDRLASGALMFERAYCMVPTCGASRASLMTSIRPSPGRFVTHLAVAEQEAPGITTLNTWLKQHGYHTISNGKVFHNPSDNAAGWSEPAWRPGQPAIGAPPPAVKKKGGGKGKAGGKAAGNRDEDGNTRGRPYGLSNLGDDEHNDGQVALKTIADLRRMKDSGSPFFIAAGFFKPHLPFICPKKYWDLYPEGTFELPANYHPPKDAPPESIHASGELRSYSGVPKTGPLPDEMARELIRGYHACVSFTDAQIGRVLDELEGLGLAENTIVILWGDHGWNLAEHTLWCKHSCYETSMRVPLILRAPGQIGGARTGAIAELIDVYPTLCELAGIPVPGHARGRSLAPLLRNPGQAWPSTAIGRFGNGDTIRTDTHRFTEYSKPGMEPFARMMYDHRVDPGENVNISEQVGQSSTVENLTGLLRAGKGRDDDLK
jgi:iduronate 2-sulfatase